MIDHSESNVPIIKNNETPIKIAPDTAGIFRRSNAKRSLGRSALAVSGTATRLSTTVTTKTAALMMMKGAAMPMVSTVKTEMTGPSANPAISTLSNLPMLPPRFSGSETITIFRSAGSDMPPPMPISSRPMSSRAKFWPKPMNKQPMMTNKNPVIIKTLARPRSANGAMEIWLKNAEKNPAASTSPSPDSLMPYLSR